MRKYTSVTIMVLALSFSLLGTVQGAGAPKDREALKGLKTAKVIFDVRVADKEKMTFHLELIKETLEGMREQGVRFEVCAVAARVFKVDTGALIPDVVMVGNVLTSLIGYQNKGYALIPMN